MPLDEVRRTHDLLQRMFTMIRRGGASFTCDSLVDDIRARLDEEKLGDNPLQRGTGKGDHRTLMTRDCLDPWIYVKIGSSASVLPCCASIEPVGSLRDGELLEDVLNNPAMIGWRRGILTGNLNPRCRECRVRGWTDVGTITMKVALLPALGRILPALHRNRLLVPLLHKLRR
ncbi:MAG: hypothetical protein FJY85_22285 [Deltaproteobacteria bacterium]|nr:hypothetical protein [Deltaproteobacteria bacterium]